ncbi:serine hydrolase [Streptomyces sp. NPDC050428]|uniref:serine hydrolase n=1 Tax=Streptomyces sp. NPDC050428 TaxID=3155757 RepID=UPI003418D3BC
MTTRRHRAARTSVVGLAVAATAATVLTAPAAQASTGRTGHEETRRALEDVVRDGIPGVASQARTGNRVWKGAAGVGNLGTGAPRGADDRFRIAGITKTFVATVMLQLESEGRLDRRRRQDLRHHPAERLSDLGRGRHDLQRGRSEPVAHRADAR